MRVLAASPTLRSGFQARIYEHNKAFYQSWIKDFKNEPFGAVLNENFIEKIVGEKAKTKPTHEYTKIGSIRIESIRKVKFKAIKIVQTPGHTRGSLCFYIPKEKILFSGDTLFDNGIGRTDLPTSQSKKMQSSLNKLKKLNYKILCAGHDT